MWTEGVTYVGAERGVIMSAMVLAVGLGGLSIIQWAILIVVLAGVVGIVLVCLKQFGIAVPGFVIAIGWIVICVMIGVLAIKLIASLL